MMNNPWNNLKKPLNSQSYTAILCDKNSILRFYWAKDFDENKIFLLQLSNKIEKIRKLDEIAGIKIVFQTNNNVQQLLFVLADTTKEDIFYMICSDLLQYIKFVKYEQRAVDAMFSRLNSWRKFLKSNKKILDKRQLMGLIAELYFLKMELFPLFGVKKSLSYWEAPEREKQDFIVDNCAIEIKTKNTQNRVTISSFEQLNSHLEKLYLYVLTVSESNQKLEGSTGFISFLKTLREEISSSDDDIVEFERKLLEYGYVYNESYDDFYVYIGDFYIYEVKDGFPRIESIKSGIENLTYKINLDTCEEFKVNEINLKGF